MKAELTIINNFTKTFKINIPHEDYQKSYNKALKKLAKKISLPGFRKGKVPPEIVKRNYHDSVHGETIDKLINNSFTDACTKQSINPVGNVQVPELNFSEEKGLDFVISFEVVPELNDLKVTDIEITKEFKNFDEKEVEDTLNGLLNEQAKVEELTDAEVEEGHYILVDSEQLDEEKNALPGKVYKNMSIHVGEGKFDKKIEKQLLGMKLDEKKFVEKKYPKSSKNKELAGKSEFFNLTLRKIEKRETPELNDEFVKSLNESGLETVDALKTRIEENLKFRYEDDANKNFIENASKTLIENNEFEVPDSMVDNYLDRLYEDQLKYKKVNEERFKSARRDSAVDEIKWQLIKEFIIKKENIKVDVYSDEGKKEIEAFIDDMKMPDEQKEFFKSNNQFLHDFAYQLIDKKVMAFLKENNKVIENEIK
jgi:trigger factor